MSTRPSWTTLDDLLTTLRRRWARGQYLRAYARGEPWESVALPVNGPTADDVLRDSAAVVAWIDALRRAAVGRRGRERFTIECRTVRSRVLGENSVPARIYIGSLEQLADLLGTVEEIERLDAVLASTRRELPGAAAWVADHPLEALGSYDVWPRLLTTARWIIDHDPSTLDLRHLDVPDVDTKFVERNRTVLGRLLDEVLPVSRIDPTASNFARRYGFRSRPRYVRLRLLSPVPGLPAQLTELELRTDELTELPLPVTTVFVVENQASYLALPEVPDAIVVFGGGFAVTTLELVPWLAEKEVVYWGDIDTHGFAILDRLREHVPAARSILMDRLTLVAHRDQLTNEPSPTSAALRHLTAEEAALYRDLVEDRYGSAVRLEQERVRFGLVRAAVAGRPKDPTESM
jgi:hypothetical protein